MLAEDMGIEGKINSGENIQITRNQTCNELIAQLEECRKKIPADKNCKICPYSQNGASRGMETPCYDLCDSLVDIGY